MIKHKKKTNRKGKILDILLYLIFFLLFSFMVFSGCASAQTSQNPKNDNQVNIPPDNGQANNNPANPQANGQNGPQGRGGRNGSFGNLTAEQRQQMMQQRIQQQIDACTGKNDGDTCTIASTFGNRTNTMNSTCTMQNETLMCSRGFNAGNRTRGGMPPGAAPTQ